MSPPSKAAAVEQPGAVTSVIRLADGRDLAWIEIGDPAGTPVAAFHGAPGSGMEFTLYHSVARECGVRLIAVDRPGYGHSTLHPGRVLPEWPDDVRQLADHLGLERFGVIGHSAGGPHALVCARFLSERLLGCGVLSGAASRADLPMMEGMVLSNQIQMAVYRHWPRQFDALAVGLWLPSVPVLAALLRLRRPHVERDLDWMLHRALPACDLAVVSRPELHDLLVDEFLHFNANTARVLAQDMATCSRAWGFDLDGISVPVHIWHGDLDRNVPVSHGEFLADSIPGAKLHLCPGEGHFLLVDHMAEILPTVSKAG